jgi:hypothetical protein
MRGVLAAGRCVHRVSATTLVRGAFRAEASVVGACGGWIPPHSSPLAVADLPRLHETAVGAVEQDVLADPAVAIGQGEGRQRGQSYRERDQDN